MTRVRTPSCLSATSSILSKHHAEAKPRRTDVATAGTISRHRARTRPVYTICAAAAAALGAKYDAGKPARKLEPISGNISSRMGANINAQPATAHALRVALARVFSTRSQLFLWFDRPSSHGLSSRMATSLRMRLASRFS